MKKIVTILGLSSILLLVLPFKSNAQTWEQPPCCLMSIIYDINSGYWSDAKDCLESVFQNPNEIIALHCSLYSEALFMQIEDSLTHNTEKDSLLILAINYQIYTIYYCKEGFYGMPLPSIGSEIVDIINKNQFNEDNLELFMKTYLNIPKLIDLLNNSKTLEPEIKNQYTAILTNIYEPKSANKERRHKRLFR